MVVGGERERLTGKRGYRPRLYPRSDLTFWLISISRTHILQLALADRPMSPPPPPSMIHDLRSLRVWATLTILTIY